MTQKETDRYDKNAYLVHKVCDFLGYKLLEGCPDWGVVAGQRKLIVPDDFMASIALLLGHKWEFGVHDGDQDYIEQAEFFESRIRTESGASQYERIVDSIRKGSVIQLSEAENLELDTNIRDLNERRRAELDGYERKAEWNRSIVKARDRLRNCSISTNSEPGGCTEDAR